MEQVFTVGQNIAGKTLSQLRDEAGLAFRPDVLAGMIGTNEKTPLTAGQTFKVNIGDTGSGEVQALPKLFGSGQSAQDYEIKKQQNLQQEAVQPVIQQFQSSKDPLKARYDKVIEDIHAQRGLQVKQAEIASAREFGKRGIPLSSGAYDTFVRENTTPVETQYNTLELQAQNEREDRLMAIDNAIATVQSGASKDAIQTALEQLRLQEQSRQFDVNTNLSKEQLSLQKQNASKVDTSMITRNGRQILINSQTGADIADLGVAGTGSSKSKTEQLAQEVINKAAGGATLSDLQKTYGSQLSQDTIVQLYTGVSPYGAPQEEYAQKILGTYKAPNTLTPKEQVENITYQKQLEELKNPSQGGGIGNTVVNWLQSWLQ